MTAAILGAAWLNSDVHDIQDSLSSDQLDAALCKATWEDHATVTALLISHGPRITGHAFSGAPETRMSPLFKNFSTMAWTSIQFSLETQH